MLNFLISPEVEFETQESEDFLNSKDVYYALSSESGFDLTALKKVSKNHSFPIPTRINRNFFQLKSARRVFPWQRPRRRHPRELNELAHNQKETSDMIIIPVDVYWGKAPDRQESWLRLFFRDSWEGASNIKNFLKVIFNGRQAKVYFHKPLETKEIFSKDESPSRLVLKTDRLLRARFRKHRQAKMGIDISSRRTLINSIINSRSVKILINSNSEGDLRKKKKLMKTAEKYAYEICSNMSYPVIYLLDKILNWFWNSRYEGLHSIGIEEVRALSVSYTHLTLPTMFEV